MAVKLLGSMEKTGFFSFLDGGRGVLFAIPGNFGT